MAGFAIEVDDGPVLFPLLDVAEIQVHSLAPSEAAGKQDRQERAISLTLVVRQPK